MLGGGLHFSTGDQVVVVFGKSRLQCINKSGAAGPSRLLNGFFRIFVERDVHQLLHLFGELRGNARAHLRGRRSRRGYGGFGCNGSRLFFGDGLDGLGNGRSRFRYCRLFRRYNCALQLFGCGKCHILQYTTAYFPLSMAPPRGRYGRIPP